jgi:hypothetical protein
MLIHQSPDHSRREGLGIGTDVPPIVDSHGLGMAQRTNSNRGFGCHLAINLNQGGDCRIMIPMAKEG